MTPRLRRPFLLPLLALGLLAVAVPARADDKAAGTTLPADWVRALHWRCIGPANMGGRIVAIAVNESDPSMWWVATASGGLLKTTNNGVTFEHQFDREATVSIGDVAVAPSNPNVVWVGTGENNPRNSVSYGDGVYKSTDGGKTWKNMGLKKSFQVGKVLIHPKNPDIVYVGALGRLYGPSEERGLFKTSDGGKTWERILYVDDKTGVIDMRMHPTEPDTLLVATYERARDLYDVGDPVKKWGPGGGLYRTTDGGKSFQKITKGLPTCQLGRIGLDWYRKDPNVVFALVESEKIGMGPPRPAVAYAGLAAEDAEDQGARVRFVAAGGPADRAGIRANDVLTAVDDKPVRSAEDFQEASRGKKAGETVVVKYTRAGKPMGAKLTFAERPRGGQPGGGRPGQAPDPKRPYGSTLGGQEANAQAAQGRDGFQTGGVFKSTDGGQTWTRINSLNPRPMYFSQIRVDPNDDRLLYVLGIQLHRSTDGGRRFRTNVTGIHADQHALWIDPRDGRHMIVGCDGGFYVTYDRMANWDHLNTAALGQFYHVALDPRPLCKVYGGLQDNGTWGGPSRTRGLVGPVNEDWINLAGGDGFHCAVDPNDPDLVYYESQYGRFGRRNLRTGEQTAIAPPRGQGSPRYRFNWSAPFVLSHRNSRIYYAAGNVVFRSLDRGNDLRPISPEITRTGQGSATALAESPKNPNVLWVGTDDGYLWLTRDGGREWVNVTKNVGLAKPMCVASVEPSRYEEGRCYVAFDGHRSDDDDPHVYVTEDFGKTWKSLRANLPWGSSRVLREDIANPNLLYLGTEFAVWASIDRGGSWAKINNNLPTVAVHELAQHPTSGEVVAATHGRSLWIVDVSALRQVKPEVLRATATLFRPQAAIRWQTEPARGRTNRRFVGENPPRGAQIYYALPNGAEQVALKVVDFEGRTVRELPAGAGRGLHRVTWDLRAGAGQRPGGGRPGGGRGPRGGAAPAVPPGMYRVVLTVDGKEQAQPLRVDADPSAPAGPITADDDEEEGTGD